MMVRRTMAASFALSALLFAAASPAWGVSRTQELPNGDYGYVDTNNTHLVICDKEADGNTAYSTAFSIGSGAKFRVNDEDGAGGYCWWKPVESGVREHITCENINNWPDNCSDQGWSYH